MGLCLLQNLSCKHLTQADGLWQLMLPALWTVEDCRTATSLCLQKLSLFLGEMSASVYVLVPSFPWIAKLEQSQRVTLSLEMFCLGVVNETNSSACASQAFPCPACAARSRLRTSSEWGGGGDDDGWWQLLCMAGQLRCCTVGVPTSGTGCVSLGKSLSL